MRPKHFLFSIAVLLAAAPLCAQVPIIDTELIPCYPRGDNGVITTTVDPEIAGVSTRLYFRWDEDEDFYYVRMRAVGGGRYWATPPKPKDENEGVEYYVALVDPLGELMAGSGCATTP